MVVGETAKLVAVVPVGPPLLQENDAPARLLPAKRVVEPPLHITVVPVMVGTGTGVTVTVWIAEAVQPNVVETTKLVLKFPACGYVMGGGEDVVWSTVPSLV